MVIAVSLASSEQAELWGVVRNAQLVRVYFPGWTLRIYMKQVAATSDVDSESSRARVISTLLVLGADIVYVDTRLAGHWWSYMIADDLSVDFALVRKPNSRLCERDAMAVKDWVELCEKAPHVAVHCLRDTTYQGSRPIMHGLWGVRPSVLHHLLGGRSLMSLIQQFVNDSCGRDDDDADDGCEPSDFLSQMLWPVVQRDAVVCHDSVSHDVWPNSLYFQRIHSHTVAQCVGAEYDGHEQLVTGCDSDGHSPTDIVSNDNVPELLV